MSIKISVIIPTYNEEKEIGECLKSLSKQSYKDLEIIIVDDGSNDNSKVIIKKAKAQVKNQKIILLEQKHKGPGAARNLGAKKSLGKILVFVDADMTFDKDFIKKLIEPIEKGKTKGTFSKEEYVSNWDNVWARCLNIEEGWMPKKRHPKDYPNKQRVFRAILRTEFERVGGFTPGGYTDDWSLGEKLGYEAIYAPGAKFFHKNPGSLLEVYRQAKWVGKRDYKMGKIGAVVALVRASIPISIVVGVVKSIRFSTYPYFIFKMVYDFGLFIGIINYLATGKGSK